MDEFLDVVNEQNQLTGMQKLKSEIHRDNDWHRASHMWIYNDQGEILFQKRSLIKDTFPGKWDITGGHVGAGETYLNTAVRELEEELGITVAPEDLETLDMHKTEDIGREFQQVYLLRLNQPSSSFRLQEEEVLEARFIPIKELRTHLTDKQARKKYCPVWPYYLRMVDIIESRIQS